MSYRQKEIRETRKWFTIASIIVAAIFLLFVTNNNLFFHHYYENAGGFWKVMGWLTTAAWYWFVWYYFPKHRNSKRWVESKGGYIIFGGLALIILFLSGFDFDLFGL